MALIGKIREKSVLLVVIIGLALVAFILGAYGKMGSGSDEQIGYGTVFGEMVDMKSYDKKNRQYVSRDSVTFLQQQREYTLKDRENSANNAWKELTDSIMLSKEFEELGIHVGDNELNAYLYGQDGFTVLPQLQQGFTDSITGMFNYKLLEKRIQDMKNSSNPSERQMWEDAKRDFTNQRKNEKYFQIVSQGLYVTKLEAEEEYYAQNEKKAISYVVKRYSEIEDEKIKISDEELKAYYEEHKNDKKYENRNASREVRYFNVLVNPSKYDSIRFSREMNVLKKEFTTTPNDSLFVLKNSSIPFYSSAKTATAVPEDNEKAQKLQSYPKYMDTVFKTATIGQVVGPYDSRGNVVISKVIGFTPSRLKARHILISTNQSKDKKIIAQKQKIADSLVKLINKDNFTEFVMKYSEDPGSKQSGGVYDNFLEADMVPEFSTFCATQPVGSIGIVKTDFGFHIIEVMERDASTFPVLASVAKTFKPSQETLDRKNNEVYSLLYKLDSKLSKLEDIRKKLAMFDTLAQQAGYFVRPLSILEEAPVLYGFTETNTQYKILKLAFNEEAKLGDMTTSPIKDKEQYIIAIVSSIREKGVPTFEDAEIVMKRDLIEEKKAKRFTSQLSKAKSLKAIAQKTRTEIMKAEVTFANPQITGAGFEPEVIGSIFSGLKPGQTTLPLKGKLGVYVIRIDKSIKAPAAADFKKEKDQLLATAKRNIQGMVMSGLKKKAEVMDNRLFLTAGVRR
jgi:peptidyl-prolyl cis-trans isomerase D